jgi:hypothetical protein
MAQRHAARACVARRTDVLGVPNYRGTVLGWAVTVCWPGLVTKPCFVDSNFMHDGTAT